MSTKPMTRAQWIAQAKKFDQKYREKATFKDPDSGRDDETGLQFGPVHGGMVHHTAGPDDKPHNADDVADSRVVNQGRTGLPGPLANTGCTDDGVLEFHTVGRANHAGKGDRDVFNAIINESYGSTPPAPNLDSVDGNDPFYGLEMYYTGLKPPTDDAYRAAVNWGAMICDFHDWKAKSLIAHKEWTRRKVDPYGFGMAKYRYDVDRRVAAVNRGTRTPIPDFTPVWKTPVDKSAAGGSITLQLCTANVMELPRHDDTIMETFQAASTGCQIVGYQETGNKFYVSEMKKLPNRGFHGLEGDNNHNVSMSYDKNLFKSVGSGYDKAFDGETGISHTRHNLWVDLQMLAAPKVHIIIVVTHWPSGAFNPDGTVRTSGDRIGTRVEMWREARRNTIDLLEDLAKKNYAMMVFGDFNRQKVRALPETIAGRQTHAIMNGLDAMYMIEGDKEQFKTHEANKVPILSDHKALQARVTLSSIA